MGGIPAKMKCTMQRRRRPWRRMLTVLLAGTLSWNYAAGAFTVDARDQLSPLQRAKIFLQAADYRRAIEACQEEVRLHPSAAGYVYLTYVYLALDRYLDHLAKTDQWVTVELVYLNLASGRPEDLARA